MLELESHSKIEIGSDRTFGIFFSSLFLLLAIWLFIEKSSTAWAPLTLSILLIVTSLLSPGYLRKANILWFKFGALLHSIITPALMAIFFFIIITPFGLMMRAVKGDFFNLKYRDNQVSYWEKIDSHYNRSQFRDMF